MKCGRCARALGLFEGSPLGKIEVRGPDAGRFLHRIYMNNVTSLQPGKVRYGLMLNENGIVIDDGVFACLSPEHYLVSTTGAQCRPYRQAGSMSGTNANGRTSIWC